MAKRIIDSLEYSLCREEDFTEALDLRYHYFLQDEPIHKSRGGHPVRTAEVEQFGRNALSKGLSLQVRDSANGNKMVALLINEVNDRKDCQVPPPPMASLHTYMQRYGKVYSDIMYLEDLHGSPGYIFQKYPDSQRFINMLGLMVHKDYRGKGIGRKLVQFGVDVAKEEFGCDGAYVLSSSPFTKRIATKLGFETYAEVIYKDLIVEGRLLFPNVDQTTATYSFKLLKD